MIYSKQPLTALRFTTQGSPNIRRDKLLDLVCPSAQLLPFQIIRGSRPDVVTVFKIVLLNEEAEYSLLPYCETGESPYILSFPDYDRIIFKATTFNTPMFGGRYYVVISDGVQTWYSTSIIRVGCLEYIRPVPIPIGADDMERPIGDISL